MIHQMGYMNDTSNGIYERYIKWGKDATIMIGIRMLHQNNAKCRIRTAQNDIPNWVCIRTMLENDELNEVSKRCTNYIMVLCKELN